MIPIKKSNWVIELDLWFYIKKCKWFYYVHKLIWNMYDEALRVTILQVFLKYLKVFIS